MLLLAAALLALSAKPRFAIHGGNANGGTLYLPLFDAHQIEQVPVDKEGNFGRPETFQLPKSISPYEVVLSNNGKTLYCGGLIDQQRMLVALSLSTSGNIQQMLGGAEPATASLITMHPSKR